MNRPTQWVKRPNIFKGDLYDWDGLRVEIRRVAKDGTWADILCGHSARGQWTKRQSLPLPRTFVRVYPGEDPW